MIGGLDIGTSNCKLSIYNDNGLMVQTEASYAAARSGGRHILDAEEVWRAVCSLFRQAVAIRPEAAGIEAFAVSALGEAAVPVDGAGRAVDGALLFWDASGVEEAEALSAALGRSEIERITGVIPNPMHTLCKMAWRKRHSPSFVRTKHFLLFEDFIIHRLTGERLISYSLAGRTMGLDIAAREWSPALFAAAGLDPAMMSRPVPSGTPAGTMLPGVAAELGLRPGALVVVGGHDQMCVAVGAGALRAGVASNGSGTVEVMAATLPDGMDPAPLHRDNYTVSLHADPDRRFTYSCNATGSLLLDWYVRTFGDGGMSFTDFEARAPARPTSLLALPYLAGAGTPSMDLDARCAVLGMGLETDRYAVYRALMEGLAFDLDDNMRRMIDAGVTIDELRTTGGGAQSPLWLQIKADVTGVPVSVLENHQAGALGCALLAATACGRYRDIYQAVDDAVRVRRTFEPIEANRRHYGEQKQRFAEAFRATRGRA